MNFPFDVEPNPDTLHSEADLSVDHDLKTDASTISENPKSRGSNIYKAKSCSTKMKNFPPEELAHFPHIEALGMTKEMVMHRNDPNLY